MNGGTYPDPSPRFPVPALVAALALAALSFAAGGCTPRSTPSTPNAVGTPAASGSAAAEVPATSAAEGVRFEDITAASGAAFRHMPGYSAAKHMPEIQGGGVIIADFDRNGAPDIVATNSGVIGNAVRPAGAETRLFLNDGAARFRDATAEWRLTSHGYGLGGTAGDIDNDGWTDLVLTGYGDATRVLRNTGSAFEDVPGASGVPGDGHFTTSAGMFDVEGDGDLDLFLARYVVYDPVNAKPCAANDVLIYCTPHLYDGLPDRLYLNDGAGHFTDATDASGIKDVRGKGLAISIADVDIDGDVDVLVANDLTPNQLWENDGQGHFTDVAARVGVAVSRDGRTQAGMGADIGDIDGDGRYDLAVSNFTHESTSVYMQADAGGYDEKADANGVGGPSRLRLKWGTAFFDADNDGDEDLMVTAGHIYDNAPEVEVGLTFAEQNLFFLNGGAGKFTDASDDAGPALADLQVSRGLAIADLDSDGGLDFVVGNNGGTLQLGHNVSAGRGNWVGLWLEGSAANRSAIGTRIAADIGGRMMYRQVKGADSYLSLSDRRLVLGLGEAGQLDRLDIVWPDGQQQSVGPLTAGTWMRLVQGREPEPFVPGAGVIAP